MIILRQKRFSALGTLKAGLSGFGDGAKMGAIIGAIVIPIIGAIPGAVIGGVAGSISGISDYRAKQKLKTPEGKEAAYKKGIEEIVKVCKSEIDGVKKTKIDPANYCARYEQYFKKLLGTSIPKSLVDYIKFYSSFCTPKTAEQFYNNMIKHPEDYIDFENPKSYVLVPAFFDLFPKPVDPGLLDSLCDPLLGICQITEHSNPDDGLYIKFELDGSSMYFTDMDEKVRYSDFRKLVKNWTTPIYKNLSMEFSFDKDQKNIISKFIKSL